MNIPENPENLELWNSGTLELWNSGTLEQIPRYQKKNPQICNIIFFSPTLE